MPEWYWNESEPGQHVAIDGDGSVWVVLRENGAYSFYGPLTMGHGYSTLEEAQDAAEESYEETEG